MCIKLDLSGGSLGPWRTSKWSFKYRLRHARPLRRACKAAGQGCVGAVEAYTAAVEDGCVVGEGTWLRECWGRRKKTMKGWADRKRRIGGKDIMVISVLYLPWGAVLLNTLTKQFQLQRAELLMKLVKLKHKKKNTLLMAPGPGIYVAEAWGNRSFRQECMGSDELTTLCLLVTGIITQHVRFA
jgi:hypothetical protein